MSDIQFRLALVQSQKVWPVAGEDDVVISFTNLISFFLHWMSELLLPPCPIFSKIFLEIENRVLLFFMFSLPSIDLHTHNAPVSRASYLTDKRWGRIVKVCSQRSTPRPIPRPTRQWILRVFRYISRNRNIICTVLTVVDPGFPVKETITLSSMIREMKSNWLK